MIGDGEYKRTIINEFEIEINKRNTIIRYNEDVDIKQLIEHIETYKKINKWKLKAFAIRNNSIVIMDKEYKEYRENNIDEFYVDNKVFEMQKPFRPKGKIRKIIEHYKNRTQ